MESSDKQRIAALVKSGRATKGYTQQELADLTRISLRSVQRIENGEVLPRLYTLRLLEEHLGVALANPPVVGSAKTSEPVTRPPGSAKARRVILTISIGLILLLLTGAYLAQSSRFPETDFERFLLWGGVLIVYTGILLRIWK